MRARRRMSLKGQMLADHLVTNGKERWKGSIVHLKPRASAAGEEKLQSNSPWGNEAERKATETLFGFRRGERKRRQQENVN